MKIAMLSPFEESVPPLKYGGTELVIYNLTEQLVKRGHEVVLLATGDSKTSANLEVTFPEAIRLNGNSQDINFRNTIKFIGIGRVLDYLSKNNFDIIHNHIGWRMLFFEKLINFPMVTTLHGPLNIDYQRMVYDEYKNSNYISISLNQRGAMSDINFVANVYNGLEIEKFQQNYKPQDYFAFLGRMSPEKGPLQAIEIAKKAGVKLIMAAKVDSVDKQYFEENIEPLIDGKQIQFIGEINHAEKVKFLGGAKALIAPIQWEEPFGLFFVEAMICGTPVVAMRRGSVSELIVDNKTGFICEGVDEAVEKINLISSLNRRDCYEHVKNNFSAEKMADGYIEAYEKVLDSKK